MSLMALSATARVFATEDGSSIVSSAVVTTETATPATLARRKMVFHTDFARRRERLIVPPFNCMAGITLGARIVYVCPMSKRCSEGSTAKLG